MQYWMGGFSQVVLAERWREEELARFEYLCKHNILDAPEQSSLRSTLAGWLLRAALRLDAQIGTEVTVRSSQFQGAASP